MTYRPSPCELANRDLRAKLQAAESALRDAEALISDLGRQLDLANEAATRMARLAIRAGFRRAA